MYTTEIQKALLTDPFTMGYYGGVIAADHLPIYVSDRPKYYVVNSDPSNEGGKHWVLFFMDNIPEFFDPLAKHPASYHKEWESFLVWNGPNYLMNTTRIQNFNSDKCGEYCVYYCKLRCRGHSMSSILSLFCNKTLDQNDKTISVIT
jgi:hypothetical protein